MENQEMNVNQPKEAVTVSSKAHGKNKGKVVGIIVAAVVLILAACGVLAWKTGLFLKPADKVLLAMKNSFSQKDTFLSSIENGFDERDAVTLNISGDYEDFSGECSLLMNSTGMGLDANFNIPSMPAVSTRALLDSEALKIQLPELSDRLFVYDYHNINENCIFLQFMEKDELNQINESLQQMVDSCGKLSKQKEQNKQLGEELLGWFRALSFDTAEAKEWTVNGEFAKCKGYTAHLSKEPQESFWNIMKKYVAQANPDMVEEELQITSGDYSEMDVTFYLFKNNLVAVQCIDASGKQVVTVTLEGGECPWQNMAVCDDKREILRMKGNTTDGVETVSLSADNVDFLTFTYQAEGGSYDLSFGNEADTMTLGGVIVSNEEEISMTCDRIVLNDATKDASVRFAMTKGATMPVLEGETFDVNASDMNAWTELLMGLAGTDLGSAILSGMF